MPPKTEQAPPPPGRCAWLPRISLPLPEPSGQNLSQSEGFRLKKRHSLQQSWPVPCFPFPEMTECRALRKDSRVPSCQAPVPDRHRDRRLDGGLSPDSGIFFPDRLPHRLSSSQAAPRPTSRTQLPVRPWSRLWPPLQYFPSPQWPQGLYRPTQTVPFSPGYAFPLQGSLQFPSTTHWPARPERSGTGW